MNREPAIVGITRPTAQNFTNYHGTVAISGALQARYEGAADSPPKPGAYFGANARVMQNFLATATLEMVPLGSRWSFSHLNASNGYLLDTSDLGRVVELLPDQIVGAPAKSGLFLAAPGVTIAVLNAAIEPQGWSISTSGSHNGPTLVGASACGTHGSVLGFGGVQNQLCGLHIVTGPDTSVWLAPAKGPQLEADFLRELDPGITIIRDDALFDAGVVHLGGLGFINAVLIQAVPLFQMEVVSKASPIDPAWLQSLSDGDWDTVAARFGSDGKLHYYELELDPFTPFTNALHSCRFVGGTPALVGEADRDPVQGRLDVSNIVGSDPAPPPGFNLFLAYVTSKDGFQTWPKPPGSPEPRRKRGTWGELLGPHTKRIPLHSFAFAIDRADIARVVPLMYSAVTGFKPLFIFALRFVDEAAGDMAFTQCKHSCVINLDGWASGSDPEGNAENASMAIRAALDAAGIEYRLHWGKLGGLDAAKVRADYGDPATPGTPAHAWTSLRNRLLAPPMRAIFQNGALRQWGLV